MRVLVVNHYYPPDAAASAYLLGELTEDLARHHDVHVVAGRPSYDPDVATYRPAGVHVTRVPTTAFSRVGIPGRLANYASFAVMAVARACLVPRPDVVVTMTDPPIAGMIGMIAAARHRRPFVQICHDVYPDIAIALGRLRGRWAAQLWRAMNGIVRRRARRLVVVGRDMAEKLGREGVEVAKLAYIPAWANDQRLDDAEIARARQAHGWEDDFVVMHAGNMGLAQNLDLFVDVAQRLRDHADIRLVFLGDGAAKPRLVSEARRLGLDNLVFLPYRPKDEAQALMSAADIHVVSLVPGLWGCATPSKVYGIMAAGRPYVAAVDAGSEPDRIASELGCGVRTEAGDSAALAQAILAMQSAAVEEMGRRARQGFEERFRRSVATRATRELLEDVVDSGDARVGTR
jgi:glycosyltransferase involved in cell wall biosynthesis